MSILIINNIAEKKMINSWILFITYYLSKCIIANYVQNLFIFIQVLAILFKITVKFAIFWATSIAGYRLTLVVANKF